MVFLLKNKLLLILTLFISFFAESSYNQTNTLSPTKMQANVTVPADAMLDSHTIRVITQGKTVENTCLLQVINAGTTPKILSIGYTATANLSVEAVDPCAKRVSTFEELFLAEGEADMTQWFAGELNNRYLNSTTVWRYCEFTIV